MIALMEEGCVPVKKESTKIEFCCGKGKEGTMWCHDVSDRFIKHVSAETCSECPCMYLRQNEGLCGIKVHVKSVPVKSGQCCDLPFLLFFLPEF